MILLEVPGTCSYFSTVAFPATRCSIASLQQYLYLVCIFLFKTLFESAFLWINFTIQSKKRGDIPSSAPGYLENYIYIYLPLRQSSPKTPRFKNISTELIGKESIYPISLYFTSHRTFDCNAHSSKLPQPRSIRCES